MFGKVFPNSHKTMQNCEASKNFALIVMFLLCAGFLSCGVSVVGDGAVGAAPVRSFLKSSPSPASVQF